MPVTSPDPLLLSHNSVEPFGKKFICTYSLNDGASLWTQEIRIFAHNCLYSAHGNISCLELAPKEEADLWRSIMIS